MKRFLIKILLMALPIIGTIIYYSIMVEPHRNGDLGRLGLLPFDDAYDNYINSLALNEDYETNIEDLDFEESECDSAVLVIGDSFSKQGGAGFSNFLGTVYPGYKIYNYRTGDDEIIRYQQFINRLVENKPLPKIVVLESVERYVTVRLAAIGMYSRPEFEKENLQASTHDSNPNLAMDTEVNDFYKLALTLDEGKDKLEKSLLDVQDCIKEQLGIEKIEVNEKELSQAQMLFSCKKKTKKSKFKFKALSKFAKNVGKEKEDLKHNFLNTQEYVKKRLDAVKDNPVLHLSLKKELFTCKGAEKDLYFFFGDLDQVERAKYKTAKQNLESLIALTKEKNFNFLFMVASDKYDLYKDFAKKNKYKKKKCQLDFFTEFNDNNRFLNCKELLYPRLKNGEKDIYRCHDSHWSPIGAKYVAEEIKRKLDSQK